MGDLQVTFTGHWTEQTFSASLSFRTPEDNHPRHVVWGMSLPELQALYRHIDEALQVERNARHDFQPMPVKVLGIPEGAVHEMCPLCCAERVTEEDGTVVLGGLVTTPWCPQEVPA